MVVLVQPRFSITFISSKEGWCGESHTLSYPGCAVCMSIEMSFPPIEGTLSTWSLCHHNGDHHFKILFVSIYNDIVQSCNII